MAMIFLSQVPPTDAWNQYPLIAVIALFISMLGIGGFSLAKWVWGEYTKERGIDRAWRENQNAAREVSLKEQALLWQGTVKDLANRWEEQDKERLAALNAISAVTNKILDKFEEHDERAKRIEQHTSTLPKKKTPL